MESRWYAFIFFIYVSSLAGWTNIRRINLHSHKSIAINQTKIPFPQNFRRVEIVAVWEPVSFIEFIYWLSRLHDLHQWTILFVSQKRNELCCSWTCCHGHGDWLLAVKLLRSLLFNFCTYSKGNTLPWPTYLTRIFKTL